mmetsp:Transcript_7554/g.15466  ORF Transcript_7554/g.15466 Transcript_7554/m.15466 type:complete len:91 (+) Transcript_7554:2332-2604(+)
MSLPDDSGNVNDTFHNTPNLANKPFCVIGVESNSVATSDSTTLWIEQEAVLALFFSFFLRQQRHCIQLASHSAINNGRRVALLFPLASSP